MKDSPVRNPATKADRDPWIGREINGKYRIVEQIGAGGAGRVYRCEHALLPGRSFALKLLHSDLTADDSQRSRFLREGEILLGLIHPSIVAVRDLGLAGEGQIYLCLDYCDGVSLREELRRRRRLPPADALRITSKVLDGLATAHGAEIVHRDLKPENIMIGAGTGERIDVRILDFGIACLGETEGGPLTQQGVILGTPQYMSPEQAAGETLDVRSDLYSVGLILYEMLAGEPAIHGGSTRAIIARQRMADIEPIRERLPDHPWTARIDALLARVLVANPADRIASAVEFRECVEGILKVPTEGRPHDSRTVRKLAVATVIVAVTGAVSWVLREGEAEATGHPGDPEGAPPPAAVAPIAGSEDDPKPATATPPVATVYLCPICGHRETEPGICFSDGVRLTPFIPRSSPKDER